MVLQSLGSRGFHPGANGKISGRVPRDVRHGETPVRPRARRAPASLSRHRMLLEPLRAHALGTAGKTINASAHAMVRRAGRTRPQVSSIALQYVRILACREDFLPRPTTK